MQGASSTSKPRRPAMPCSACCPQSLTQLPPGLGILSALAPLRPPWLQLELQTLNPEP